MNRELDSSSESSGLLFSILIIVKNEERNIRNCIESILSQTYANFEVVVVNDSSDDNTQEEINQFTDPRIRSFILKEYGGRAFARNFAMKMARGTYLVIQDADDTSVKDRLMFLKEVITSNQNIAYSIICGQIKYKSKYKFFRKTETIPEHENIAKSIIGSGEMSLPHAASCLLRASVLRVGGYPNYQRCQDFALFINLREYPWYMDHKIHVNYQRSPITRYSKYIESTRFRNSVRRDLLLIHSPDPSIYGWLAGEFTRLVRVFRNPRVDSN